MCFDMEMGRADWYYCVLSALPGKFLGFRYRGMTDDRHAIQKDS
jgi:hypothetical protein